MPRTIDDVRNELRAAEQELALCRQVAAIADSLPPPPFDWSAGGAPPAGMRPDPCYRLAERVATLKEQLAKLEAFRDKHKEGDQAVHREPDGTVMTYRGPDDVTIEQGPTTEELVREREMATPSPQPWDEIHDPELDAQLPEPKGLIFVPAPQLRALYRKQFPAFLTEQQIDQRYATLTSRGGGDEYSNKILEQEYLRAKLAARDREAIRRGELPE